MPCVLKLEPSLLRLPTLDSGSSPALPLKCMRTFNFRKIFKCTFKIYGIWPQAQSVGWSHTHTSAQCSPASVGLAQARPNYHAACKYTIQLAHTHPTTHHIHLVILLNSIPYSRKLQGRELSRFDRNKIFVEKTFADCYKTSKFTRVFSLKSFPL